MSSKKRDSSTGYISLLDSDNKVAVTKKYGSVFQRNETINHWKKIYKLDNKSYGLVISPDINKHIL